MNQLKMVLKCRRFKTCVLVLWMCLSFGLFHIWGTENVGEDPPKSIRSTYDDFQFFLQKATQMALTSTLSYNEKSNQPDNNLTTNQLSANRKEVVANDNESFIQSLAPNVPYEFWMREKSKISSGKFKHTCAYYPSVLDLQFNNK